jgi:hypothetical protein
VQIEGSQLGKPGKKLDPISKIARAKRAGSVAQVVARKCEALSSNLNASKTINKIRMSIVINSMSTIKKMLVNATIKQGEKNQKDPT